MTLAEVDNIYYILYMNKFTYWLQNLALKIEPGRKNFFIGPSTYIWLKIEYRWQFTCWICSSEKLRLSLWLWLWPLIFVTLPQLYLRGWDDYDISFEDP